MKFTKKYVNEIAGTMHQQKMCIALDMLALYFTNALVLKTELKEGDTQIITEDCYLLCIDKPTPHFKSRLILMYKKQECAHVLYNSQSEKFFKKDVCKIEFINHTLYSGIWFEIYELITKKFGLIYKSASRVDIAIDGVGYLKKLLNIYIKQTPEKRILSLKNSSEKRSILSPKVFNPKTLECENFNLGTKGGNKMITIYNKSLEILKSGKLYIMEYWRKNGMIDTVFEPEIFTVKMLELEQWESEGALILDLAEATDIYRFEIRLKSESVKEIENFNPEMLVNKGYLASLVKLHCKNYFEMTFVDNKNASRCTGIELLPYERLEAQTINRIERVEKDGLYKAKLLIHGLVLDTYKGLVKNENYNETIEVIMDRVEHYQLTEYLDNKLLEWHNAYSPLIDENRVNEVVIIINQLKRRNGQMIEDFKDIATRNNQSDATAYFGED